jgi:hypothetical protein
MIRCAQTTPGYGALYSMHCHEHSSAVAISLLAPSLGANLNVKVRPVGQYAATRMCDRAPCARAVDNLPFKEGGNALPRVAPRVHLVVGNAHEYEYTGITDVLSTAMVLRFLLPPCTGFATSPADMFCPPVGPTNSAKHPDATIAVRCNISRPLAVDRSQAFNSPCNPVARKRCRSTASHPCPTIAIFLCGLMRKVRSDWGGGNRNIFRKIRKRPTLSTNSPTGKSPHGGKSKFRSCPGRGAAPFGLAMAAG